ncbi:glycerophosphodiester phosphodiesterase family protein [uncultured Lacinutrix sp.]|uniref:glycerophosphodiester phosphodiesterase n=1 Tax=uncultured Lacinutrix sp. TaxID=574032 RepID=UPI002613E0B4|nr:glycerophosphodiester phosphodiesterase family protein [uncultured Lacinutrix sp.]
MSKKVLAIGHRGAKGYVVENTLESIKRAIELNVDGIEIDVHLCKSGELVVFHDFTVDRLTNGSGEISNFTLQELKALKLEGDLKIPTLQEVLSLIDRRCHVNIELKGHNTPNETCKLVRQYIKEYQWETNSFVVSSFQLDILEKVFKIDNNIPIGVLTDTNLEQAITFGKKINAKAIHPNYTMLTKANVKKMKTEGFNVNTWTVNEIEAIKRMQDYKVDAIISDFPDRI